MKNARHVTRYKTHSLLLPSLPSPSFTLTKIPPVFCVRAYRRGEGSSSHAGGLLSATRSPHEDGASEGAVSVAERPGGIQAPGTETNGMQGPLISFCALCGREFKAQKTRRGQPKRFCSDACRARAWRQQRAMKTVHVTKVAEGASTSSDVGGAEFDPGSSGSIRLPRPRPDRYLSGPIGGRPGDAPASSGKCRAR